MLVTKNTGFAICCVIVIASAFALTSARHASAAGTKVSVVSDIAYYAGPDADARRNDLDLYVPGDGRDLPVLVYVHGGGWRHGDKDLELNAGFARTLAENGILCANVNYRLTPDVKFPEHVKDGARAVAWVYNNIASYGGDPGRIFLAGHSAGGQIVSLLALDPKYLAAESLSPSIISGAISISGALDFTDSGRSFNSGKMVSLAIGTDPAVLADASPITHVRKDAPPMLFLAGGLESGEFKFDARNTSDKLAAAGGVSEWAIIPFRTHAGMIRNARSAKDKTMARVLGFIGEYS